MPANTPADAIAALNKAVNSITDDAKAAASLKRNGELAGLSVKATDDFVKAEVGSWGKRVKAAGIQID